MRAIVCPKYGPPEVLQLAEVQKPIPADDEVLHPGPRDRRDGERHLHQGLPSASSSPDPHATDDRPDEAAQPIIGDVLSGEVESIGKDVRRFEVGDQVYGLTGFGLGAYAEYKCMRETDSTWGCLARKPANLTHEEATAVAYGGLLAFQFMEKGNIQRGQDVLVYGASSTSGTTAVQFAKHLGAKVTGVCGTANLELGKSLGADCRHRLHQGRRPRARRPVRLRARCGGQGEDVEAEGIL